MANYETLVKFKYLFDSDRRLKKNCTKLNFGTVFEEKIFEICSVNQLVDEALWLSIIGRGFESHTEYPLVC